ncbi:hypothetical protein [Paenibacillus polymyxa]|uniref:hypothetical protein n=1 Tax=Paenibacillus polymyxa TaxID=1406 RepID=UPI002ED49E03|nr:hypothetical protein [Paenibacillus polymyxa]
MEKLTEQRVREIVREELGLNMVTLSPTVVVKTGADMDEIIKKIGDHLESQFVSTAKGVYGDEEPAPETQKRTKTENNGTFKVGVSSFSINQSNEKSEMTLGLYFDDPSNGVDAFTTFLHQLNQMIHEKGWGFPSFKS